MSYFVTTIDCDRVDIACIVENSLPEYCSLLFGGVTHLLVRVALQEEDFRIAEQIRQLFGSSYMTLIARTAIIAFLTPNMGRYNYLLPN